MPKLIPDRGPRSAKIVVIGEAPGKREFEEGAPFVGPSGWLLDQWQRDAGIDRASVYYTNVVRYWPGEFAPRAVHVGLNDFKWLPKEIVDAERRALLSRLSGLDDPIVIVPTGNHALRALFGDSRKITDYRGSILSVGLADRNGNERRVKCIPTIHPAATFRRPVLTRFCVADWKRIAEDSLFRALRIPARRSVIASSTEYSNFKAELAAHGGPVACDIECSPADGHLQCIAWSFDPSFALVIPLDIPGHDSSADPFLKQCWEWARELCGTISFGSSIQRGGEGHQIIDSESFSARASGQYRLIQSMESTRDNGRGPTRIAKVLQNGLFDQFILKQRGGIELEDYVWDTLEMDHALFANDGSDPQASEEGEDDIKIPMHSLSVLCSLHTRQPFYKGDARDGFKFGWNRLEDLWQYNALDAMVTIEIFYKLKALMEERGLL